MTYMANMTEITSEYCKGKVLMGNIVNRDRAIPQTAQPNHRLARGSRGHVSHYQSSVRACYQYQDLGQYSAKQQWG